MTDSTGTGSGAGNGDGSQQDLVPPAGESQGDKAPGDDWISRKQFVAALNNVSAKVDAAERRATELQARLDAQAGQREQPKPPTRAELLQMVDSGDLTREQADAIWEKQIIERASLKATTEVGQAMGASERTRKVDAELSGYKQLVGTAWEAGTPERAKAESEYKYLTEVLGHPATKETEAAALRAAFGDLATLRASKTAKPGPADTHAEVGGGKPAADGGARNDALKSLSPEKRAYYQKGIEAGRYKDWGAVRAELEYRPKAHS